MVGKLRVAKIKRREKIHLYLCTDDLATSRIDEAQYLICKESCDEMSLSNRKHVAID